MIKCRICNKEYKNWIGFSNHLKIHSLTSQQYYDLYLKKTSDEDICNNPECENKCRFVTIVKGYKKYCSYDCSKTNNYLQSEEYKKNLSNGIKKSYASGKRKHTNRIPWNKGLTKETSEKVAEYSRKGAITQKERNFSAWNKGLPREQQPAYKRVWKKESLDKISRAHKERWKTHKLTQKEKDKVKTSAPNIGRGGKLSKQFFSELYVYLNSQNIVMDKFIFGAFDYENNTLVTREKYVSVTNSPYSTKKCRFLDCYIKIGDREINIEFDEVPHFSNPTKIFNDIIREHDIKYSMPDLEIIRVFEKNYTYYKSNVFKEIEDYIKNAHFRNKEYIYPMITTLVNDLILEKFDPIIRQV